MAVAILFSCSEGISAFHTIDTMNPFSMKIPWKCVEKPVMKPFLMAMKTEIMVFIFAAINFCIAWENSRHLATLRLVSPPNDVWETSAEIPDLGGCFCVSSLQLLPLHLQCSRSTSFYLLLYSSVLSYASPLVVFWPFLILCLESTDFFPLVYKVP